MGQSVSGVGVVDKSVAVLEAVAATVVHGHYQAAAQVLAAVAQPSSAFGA